MNELAVLAAAGTRTALATGVGAVPVFALGPRARGLRPMLLGVGRRCHAGRARGLTLCGQLRTGPADFSASRSALGSDVRSSPRT